MQELNDAAHAKGGTLGRQSCLLLRAMLMWAEPVIATETATVSGTATRASASGGSVDAENAINLAYRPSMPITRQTWVAGIGIRITSV